jgi:gamma-glutamyltranspeptidase/glutathione hydrolase
MQFGGLVGQAEGLAQTGIPVSKALARELQQYGDALREDPALANIFLRADGSLVADGDNIRQTDLSASLGQVRAQGVNGFYGGLLGQALVESAQAIGAPLTIEDLRNYKVQISAPVETQFLDLSLYVPGPPVTGGQLMSQAVAMLNGGDNSPAGQMNISRQLMASQGGVTQNPSAASVVAVDSDGVAVACAFTMNAPFGAARVAPGTGIVLAPAPTDQGIGFSALAPVMLASKFNGELYFASAGSGGAPAALAEALILDAVMKRAMPLDQAMQLPRAYDSGAGEVLDESGGLRLGRLNSIFCSRGVPANADTCQLRNDYRGNGLASILGED